MRPNYNSSIYLFALIYTSRVNVFKTESEEFELWCLRGYRKLVKVCLSMISLSPEERNTGFPILALHVYLCSLCCGNFQEVQLSFPLNRGTCDNTFKASFFSSVLSSCLVISPPFPHLLTHIKHSCVYFCHSFPHSLPRALFGSITWPPRLVAVATSPNGAGYLPCYRSNWFPAGFQMSHSISLSLSLSLHNWTEILCFPGCFIFSRSKI